MESPNTQDAGAPQRRALYAAAILATVHDAIDLGLDESALPANIGRKVNDYRSGACGWIDFRSGQLGTLVRASAALLRRIDDAAAPETSMFRLVLSASAAVLAEAVAGAAGSPELERLGFFSAVKAQGIRGPRLAFGRLPSDGVAPDPWTEPELKERKGVFMRAQEEAAQVSRLGASTPTEDALPLLAAKFEKTDDPAPASPPDAED